MYKNTARSLRRATNVHAIAVAPVLHAVEDDFIPTCDNMDERQCMAERAQLILEKTRTETELAIAKREGDAAQVKFLGHKLANLAGRLSLIKKRLHVLRQSDAMQAFCDAVKQVVPADMLELIYARQNELKAERERTAI